MLNLRQSQRCADSGMHRTRRTRVLLTPSLIRRALYRHRNRICEVLGYDRYAITRDSQKEATAPLSDPVSSAHPADRLSA